jgi:hypothetical protein
MVNLDLFGRNTLIEIDLIRLEAVFVAMLCRRFSLKMLLKLASKIVEMMTWTKYAGVLLSFVDRKYFWFCIYYEVFLKYLCEHPRVRLTFWKLMCWICLHPRVHLKFYVRFSKMNWEGSSYCSISNWLKFDDDVLPFSSVWFLMLQRCVVFADDDATDLLIEAFICWNFRQYDKRNLKTICLLWNWKTCSWYWLPESFRRHYEGPLTEVLLKIQWMIEKLIQDNVVVLRTIRLPRHKLVLPHDEVDWCASAGSACEELLNSLFKIGIAGQLW